VFYDHRGFTSRRSNENTNGLLRQYFPKGTDMAALTQDDLDNAAHSSTDGLDEPTNGATPSEKLAEVLQ
jgi:hypothetical protein